MLLVYMIIYSGVFGDLCFVMVFVCCINWLCFGDYLDVLVMYSFGCFEYDGVVVEVCYWDMVQVYWLFVVDDLDVGFFLREFV